MKGLVFTEFFEMVEEKLGFELVEQLIEQTQLATGGAYTSVGTYDHKELLALVGNLHRLTNTPVNDLLETYGQYLFPKLITIAPDIVCQFGNSFELLAAVDSIIHVEVQKLYPEAELPKFSVIKHNEKEMQLTYTSCRPFAYLAKGLILGCSEHYNEKIVVDIENRERDSLISISLQTTHQPPVE
ncbi:MAG: hypothetical protein ACJA13_003949 [Paraglaciecola sp.]|jgi:hypothetical protein